MPYWIGPGKTFASVDEVLNNPEKCVREMCRAWKRGRATDWRAYKNGYHSKYLKLYS